MKYKKLPIREKKNDSFLQRLLDPERFQGFKFILQEKSSYFLRRHSLKQCLRRDLAKVRMMRDQDRAIFEMYAMFRKSPFFQEFENYSVVMRNVKEWSLPKKYQTKIEQLDLEFQRKLQVYRIACTWKKTEKGFAYYQASFYSQKEASVRSGGKWYQLAQDKFLYLVEIHCLFLDKECEPIHDETRLLNALKKQNEVVALLVKAERGGGSAPVGCGQEFFYKKQRKVRFSLLEKNSTIRCLGRVFVFGLLLNVESYFDVCQIKY
ncbi:MAG: hypothetical protein HG424_002850 [candidate division SR1 bacterium]|nr:hypothetical protein [candidate division SR1 bacterium]